MAPWQRQMTGKSDNRPGKPSVVSIGHSEQLKSITTHVSKIDEPLATSNDDRTTPAAAKLSMYTNCPPITTAATRSPDSQNADVSRSSKGVVKGTGTPSQLLNLPVDIILHLSYHLTYNSLLALRSTCRPLHSILSLDHVAVIRTRLVINCLADEAMERDAYRRIVPRYRDTLWNLFSIAFEWQLLERPAKELRCYECLEIKPLRMFVERMSSKGTGLGGRYARQRRCKDCMRRGMSLAGVWWREHWLRRNETVRRTGRVERYVGWVVRGTEPSKVKKGQEVGVCTECGTGQFELYWGCAGCFEKEQTRRQREEWSMMGIEPLDDESLLRWALEKSEAWRGRRDKKKRERHARRAECGGKWWNPRRYAGLMGIDVRWRGSWAERVESLVDHLEHSRRRQARSTQTQADNSVVQDVPIHDTRKRPTQLLTPEKRQNKNVIPEWRPTDQMPLRKDRRETRCSTCWTPSCRRRRYMGGLTYGLRLDLDKCCTDCQEEERLKLARKGRLPTHLRHQIQDADRENALECLERLFATPD